MSQQLFKTSAIVGSMTMVSRLLGFIRDMLLANIFGVSPETDAFFVAFKIPNFLRRLFAEGAFAHAFVPVLSAHHKNASPDELKLFIAKTAGTLALVQILLSVLGIFASPVLIMLFAPGFLSENGQFELAVKLLQITFPYLFFICMTAFAGSVLNTFGKFAIPAITPVFLNICMILAALWLSPQMEEPIMALAWGVVAAGVVQFLFQIPALQQIGLLPKLLLGFNDPQVKRIIQLMLPAIFGASVVQINLLTDTLFTSFLISGSVSWLYYSDRLVEFPLGIFGVAVSTVILPNLSKNHAAENAAEFSKSLDWALKLVLLIGLPATLGLTYLAEPLISTLFQYNEFDANDVRMTSKSLVAFSLGLLAFILIKVLVPGFTSRQDMQTPARFGIYSILVNLGLNILLIIPMAHAGPALATTIAAYLNAMLLLRTLIKENVYTPAERWLSFLGRIILASGIMIFFLYYFVDSTLWLSWKASQRSLSLMLIIALAILIYAFSLWVLGVRFRHLSANQN